MPWPSHDTFTPRRISASTIFAIIVPDSFSITCSATRRSISTSTVKIHSYIFYRSDPARRDPAGGSGLGLAIAAKAVQGMGGTIRAFNVPGGGLAIEITLPKEEHRDAEDPDHRG